MSEKTLLERLKETAEWQEGNEQGGGAAIILFEAIDEIERLYTLIKESSENG
jgi:hypothetical protein